MRRQPNPIPTGKDFSTSIGRARRSSFRKKVPISIRVDVDVLAYFKELGAGYQRRMNAVLRTYMLQSQRSEARGLRRAKKTAE